MGGNNNLKFIAVAVLLEYVFIKPRDDDKTDFIGFVLVHAVSCTRILESDSKS